jgi:hypothetical protein
MSVDFIMHIESYDLTCMPKTFVTCFQGLPLKDDLKEVATKKVKSLSRSTLPLSLLLIVLISIASLSSL